MQNSTARQLTVQLHACARLSLASMITTWSLLRITKIASKLQKKIHFKVPENAPEAISESPKTKISWGGMPPDPPRVHVLIHMYTGLRPPLFHKYSFRPPLDQFLNEGLNSINIHVVRYSTVHLRSPGTKS